MTNLNPQHQLYADLVDEARIRIHAIRDIISARAKWTPRLLQEFVYLQLRMLCETIAVSCLIAHSDATDRKTLGSWKPYEIIKRLEVLNPDFFPRGVRMRADGGSVNLEDYPVPQMTKQELIDLWDESGTYLHRKSAKNIVGEHGKMLSVDLTKITDHGQRILNLLDQHIISSADKTQHVVVALGGGGGAPLGQTSVWLALSPHQKS